MFIVCVILVVFFATTLGSPCQDQAADFLVSPESQNISSDSKATFSCGGIGLSLKWFINDTALDLNLAGYLQIEHEEMMSDCNVNSNITIPGNALTNNTEISCEISASGLSHETSEKALLTVQGPPDSVGNLSIVAINGSKGSHTLSWSAPSTLNGIDTFYYVTAIDESTGGQLIATTLSTVTTHSLVLVACHRYKFSVIPWNEAGNGTEASLEYFFAGAPVSPLAENISVSSLALNPTNNLVIATLQYPVTSICYVHQNITIIASEIGANESVFTSVTKADNNTVNVALGGIPLNKVLTVDIVFSNEFGNDSVVGGVLLRTYNVQMVGMTRSYTNGTSCFQCVFLYNSQVDGCLLNLKPIDTNTCSGANNVTLARINNCSVSEMCIDGIQQGTYNIEVYDVYNSSNSSISYSENPQILTNMYIKGTPCIKDAEIPDITSTRETLTTTTPTFNTPSHVGRKLGSIQTAVVLVSVFGGILIIILAVMLVIFIYRKRHMKGGSLQINQSSLSVEVSRVSTIQGDEISQMQSFSSLCPPPYQPPPQITRDDQFEGQPMEQYIIMHSASMRSPSASNSTSSQLGLVQNPSPHKDTLVTSGHYDHLQQVDDDDMKKRSLDHLLRATNNDHRYNFELKPYYRNEHLV